VLPALIAAGQWESDDEHDGEEASGRGDGEHATAKPVRQQQDRRSGQHQDDQHQDGQGQGHGEGD
jgi:hypothetical protein